MARRYSRRDFFKVTGLAAGGAVALGALPSGGATAYAATDPYAAAWQRAGRILARVKPPTFPDRTFTITDYGAVGDGVTDCTQALRSAIEHCNAAGGGHVLVPDGTFLTGAVHLLSNVDLHLADAANLKFSQDPAAYLPVVFTRWEGMELMNYSPFIYAFDQQNIAITGTGTLDGQSNSEAWWPWNGRSQYGWKDGDPNQKKARAVLIEMVERGVAVPERVFGAGHYLRPNFIQPYRCKNVLIEDVTIVNSPMWEIHPVLCTNVTVQRVKINSHGPNNDGCDPESCTDVLIKDCYFDTGDDCIAIKSGRNADGRRLNVPTENVIIQGCHMKDGHGGITVGSEISGGVRNLFGENCRMDSPTLDHGLRVKNNAMRGGLLENFYFRNIQVGRVAHAVVTIDFNYEEGDKGKFIPVMRNFVARNLKSGKSEYALDVQGFKHAPIFNLSFEDCVFENVAEPSILKNVEGLKLHNIRVNGKLVNSI